MIDREAIAREFARCADEVRGLRQQDKLGILMDAMGEIEGDDLRVYVAWAFGMLPPLMADYELVAGWEPPDYQAAMDALEWDDQRAISQYVRYDSHGFWEVPRGHA